MAVDISSAHMVGSEDVLEVMEKGSEQDGCNLFYSRGGNVRSLRASAGPTSKPFIK